MGLFDKIGDLGTFGLASNNAAGPASYLAQGHLAGKALSGIGGALNPEIPKPAPPPEIDSRLGSIRDRQFGLAQQFRTDAPGLQSQAQGTAENQAKLNIGQGVEDVTKAANSRGLLYSGLRKAGEGEVAQKEASGLAKRRGDIAKEFQAQQQQLDQQAFESGAKMQQLEQARYDAMYKAENDWRQQQMASKSSPLGIAGQVVGGGGGLLGGITDAIGGIFG